MSFLGSADERAAALAPCVTLAKQPLSLGGLCIIKWRGSRAGSDYPHLAQLCQPGCLGMWDADEVSKGLAALPATASWRRRSLGGGRAGASRLGRRAVLAWIPCLDKLSSFLTAAAKVQPIGPARRTEEFQKARCLCGRLVRRRSVAGGGDLGIGGCRRQS